MFDQPDWNAVRAFLSKQGGEQLYRRVQVTVFDEESGGDVVRTSYEPVKVDGNVATSFARIEADVARLVQELISYQQSDRELRNALEDEAPAANIPRR